MLAGAKRGANADARLGGGLLLRAALAAFLYMEKAYLRAVLYRALLSGAMRDHPRRGPRGQQA